MNSITKVSSLNEQFGRDGQLMFRASESGQTIIEVKNGYSQALISLQGGHLLSWIPEDQSEVIWLSDAATLEKGRSVRGGIPICWPWFGAHSSETDFPSHGFARTSDWHVNETICLDDGRTYLSLKINQELVPDEQRMAGVDLEVQITVGQTLEMVMLSTNNSENVAMIGGAFHTYFNISDVDNVQVNGLENHVFIDTLDDWQEKTEINPIKINSEIDRIYKDSPEKPCVIVDSDFNRTITINKQGSHSSVVWNPWIDKSKKLGDMGHEGYRKMLCVESTNAAEDVIKVLPGHQHSLSVHYQVKSL